MLQGRNNDHLRERRGGLVPGRVEMRIAHFHCGAHSFNSLGTPGTDDKLTALGHRRANGGKIKLVWAEK